ncbi:MAG TPA: alanine:cation symporter family protein [Acholeplasmataceae bacterium]|nr:alanine:cation symporter family protein [Acholeplasmataceae bacterium]
MFVGYVTIVFFAAAVFFSLRYRFLQLRAFRETKAVMLKEKNRSSYQTFMVSLASHVGAGNIVGIATAVLYGGAGALFWMWVFAVFSSIFALAENTLAQVYKEEIGGEYRGGACFYIRKGLNNAPLALVFAACLVLSNSVFFQPIQVNTVSESLQLAFGSDRLLILIGLIVFTILVIFRGTKSIISFCERIVPVMTLTFLATSIAVLACNVPRLPAVFAKIFREAFRLRSLLAGAFGSCLIVGFKRSLFSNEAGLGTMPSINAMADVEYPLQQGFISVVGVFTDTIVLCTLMGLMLLLYDVDPASFTGCDLIVHVFEEMLGTFGKYLAFFFLFTFSIATVVSQFYAGESNMLYLVNRKRKKKPYLLLYKCLFLTGIIIGVNNSTKATFYIVDTGIIVLGIINLYAVFRLRKVFTAEIDRFYGRACGRY